MPSSSPVFRARRLVPAPPEAAWAALADMPRWLCELPTVVAVHHDESLPFLRVGCRYRVRTPEGVTMRCAIVAVDPERHVVSIRARTGPLRSALTCSVTAQGDGHSLLERSQHYPGPVGRLFARLFARREQEETERYLEAWAARVEGTKLP